MKMALCIHHMNLSTMIYNLKINMRTEETAFLNWELTDKVSSRNQMSIMQIPLSRVGMTSELFSHLLHPLHLSKSKPTRGVLLWGYFPPLLETFSNSWHRTFPYINHAVGKQKSRKEINVWFLGGAKESWTTRSQERRCGGNNQQKNNNKKKQGRLSRGQAWLCLQPHWLWKEVDPEVFGH